MSPWNPARRNYCPKGKGHHPGCGMCGSGKPRYLGSRKTARKLSRAVIAEFYDV